MKIALRTLGKSHNIIMAELTENLLSHIKNGLELSKYAFKNFPFSSGISIKIPIENNDIAIYKLRSAFLKKVEDGEKKLDSSHLEHLCFDKLDHPSSLDYMVFDDDESLNFFIKSGGQFKAIIIERDQVNIEITDDNSESFLSETIPASAFRL